MLRNETVLSTLQERTLVVRIAERRMTWFEPVFSRMGSERLPAKILHRSVNEIRGQLRQPRKWMNNVKEDKETRKFHFQRPIPKQNRETSDSSLIVILKNDRKEKRRSR